MTLNLPDSEVSSYSNKANIKHPDKKNTIMLFKGKIVFLIHTSKGVITRLLSFVPSTRPSSSSPKLPREFPIRHCSARTRDCCDRRQPPAPQSQNDLPYPNSFMSCPLWHTAMQPKTTKMEVESSSPNR